MLFVLSLFVFGVCGGNCIFSEEMIAKQLEPAPGACEGPLDRVMQKRASQALTSCGVDKIPFYVDGVQELRCGSCYPGSTFVEDGACSLGEYCSDDGSCVQIEHHPLRSQPCPFENGGHSSSGWCGAGLRCIQGRCAECMPNAVWGIFKCDAESWMWTHAAAQAATCQESGSVTGIFLEITIAVELAVLLVLMCCKTRSNSSAPSGENTLSSSGRDSQ